MKYGQNRLTTPDSKQHKGTKKIVTMPSKGSLGVLSENIFKTPGCGFDCFLKKIQVCCRDLVKVSKTQLVPAVWFSSPKYVKTPTPCTNVVVTSSDGLSTVATSFGAWPL